ncbi:MAG: hypothetical protein JJ939_09330 [Alphaproteobacteria bacterium]|nr:hypothetical protein [Rhodobiaceae bacterium]MBO6543936.1 hypothetical protein [Alphaproteobacteria bacterium]MBO6628611.1 hypothetical protein [Alphaproteobacteria bacterium]MDF1626830.1 hypothetical protein [Parvibaculaceae bacterium]
MNAMTEIQMEGVVERFEDLGALEEGWTTLSRADLRAENATRGAVRRVTRTLIISVLILLLFNSEGLVRLVQGLSVGPVQNTIIVMSETWHEEMVRHGVAGVLEDIRGEVAALMQTGWDAVGLELDGVHLSGESMPAETENRASILRGAVLETSGS